jgi:hypothetical protein
VVAGGDVDAAVAAGLDGVEWASFCFTPVGSSWLNQIEIWFGFITQQAIRWDTFGSLRVLVDIIDSYIAHWNQDARPFVWTATSHEIIAKVRVLQRDFRRLAANNSK